MERMTHERCNGIKTGYWSAATKEALVQRLALYENTGLEPWEIGPAIEKAAKDAETATATKMAECIAGGIKDTVEAIHRDPDGFFKGGARRKTTRPSPVRRSTPSPAPPAIWARPT